MAVKITGRLKGRDYVQITDGDNPLNSSAVTFDTLKSWLGLSDEEIAENIEAPTILWTKSEIREWMDRKEVKYNSGDSKQNLLNKIKGTKK